MACSVQMVKPSSASITEQWKTVFPTDFTTLTGSRQFIKKLMTVSLSAITYVRDVFPEKAYGERNLCGMSLKILTKDSGLQSVNKFIDLIRSCYEAIDKKYLEQVIIGIGCDAENRDNVLESYTMNFRYREDEFSVSNKFSSVTLNENNPTVEATFWLLKSIMTVSDILGPLPENAFLTMKLLYNDEITPEDYEPSGFAPSDNDKFLYPSSTVKLEIGKVTTDFNNYKMYLKTALGKEPLSQLLEESMMAESQKTNPNVEADEGDVFPPETTPATKSDIENSSDHAQDIECVCRCKQDSGIGALECLTCGRKQHSICYGITNPEEVDSDFYCIHCINEAPFRSSQEDMIHSLDRKEQQDAMLDQFRSHKTMYAFEIKDTFMTTMQKRVQDLGAFRRALVYCMSVKHVTPYQLERGLKCDRKLAKDLVGRLELEGFVRKSGQKYIINESKIRNDGFRKYFPRDVDDSARTRRSKTKSPESESLIEVGSTPKRTSVRTKRQSLSHVMDSEIDEKIKKLDLKEKTSSVESQQTRSSRRSLRIITQNDSQEYEGRPKRRCLRTNEDIKLGK